MPQDEPISTCRSCGAYIIWTRSNNGKPIPLDISTTEWREGRPLALNHFATCPHGRDWRKK